MYKNSALRAKRAGIRGQVVVVATLVVSILLLGAAGLAIDLSLNANTFRLDQNASDSGALAGARDIGGASPNVTAALQAALDATGRTEGWITGATQMTPVGCGLQCRRAKYPSLACSGINCYTVIAVTPAPDAAAGTYCDPSGMYAANCLEVTVSHSVSNAFGFFAGQTQSVVSTRSIAYHYGTNSAFPVAFYAVDSVTAGNTPETVEGDVYIGNYFNPSGSFGSLCAAYAPGDPLGTQSGHILWNQGASYSQVVYSNIPPASGSCTNSSGSGPRLGAEDPAPVSPNINCDYNFQYLNSGGNPYCVNPSYPAALENPPPCTSPCVHINCLSPALGPTAGNDFDPAFPPGVYMVDHGSCGGATTNPTPDLTINLGYGIYGPQLNCYTFILGPDAVVKLNTTSNGLVGVQAANIQGGTTPSSGGDSRAETFSHSCSASSSNAARNVFTVASGVTNGSGPVIWDNGGSCGGGCTRFDLWGSVYAPYQTDPNYKITACSSPSTNYGTICTNSNTNITVFGDATVYNWVIQSGNHPGANVVFLPNNIPPIPEVLRLVQ